LLDAAFDKLVDAAMLLDRAGKEPLEDAVELAEQVNLQLFDG
jgi:hypothetical protein